MMVGIIVVQSMEVDKNLSISLFEESLEGVISEGNLIQDR